MTKYEEAQAALIARAVAGDFPTFEEMAAVTALGHAEKYPDGCRVPGHHCEECNARLGREPHPMRSYKVGHAPATCSRRMISLAHTGAITPTQRQPRSVPSSHTTHAAPHAPRGHLRSVRAPGVPG